MLKNLYLLLCIVFVTSYSCPVFAQVISTIGGDGIAGYSGDGYAATLARLDSPSCIAVDGAGNIYISDQKNNCVRKISKSGVISTIAGTGTAGYNGDGIATASKLFLNWGIAVDGTGNVYIADQLNHLIRKVTPGPGGTMTTIAGVADTAGYSGDGGTAILAKFRNPLGIAVDNAGNIYISDQGAYCIRKINTSGIISTFAGSSSSTSGYTGDGGPATNATFKDLYGLATDAAGNVYICDGGNNCIRKVNTAGIISTVAGNGTAGYFGDNGPATAAYLYLPTSVNLDNIGHIFIADNYNNRIRVVNTSTGIISTIAGTGVPGFYGDGGLAINAKLWLPVSVATDDSANIYISDLLNVRIRKIRSQNLYFARGHSQNLSICENEFAASLDSLLSVADNYYPGSTDTWSNVSAPVHGTLHTLPYSTTSTGGTIYPTGLYYKPVPGYYGNDSFKVKVTDGLLSDTTTIYVTVVPLIPPIAPIIGASWVCLGGTTTLTDPVPGGIWSISNLNATVSGGVVTGQSLGTDIISYVITNMCGTSSASVVIAIEPLPDAGIIIGDSELCTGSSVIWNEDISGGVWSENNGVISLSPNDSICLIKALSAGTATVYYTVKDSFCTSSATHFITIDSFPNSGIINGPTTVCTGSSITLSDASPGGNWQISNGNATFDSGIVTGIYAGMDTISYIVTNFCGTAVSSVTITINPSPVKPSITEKGSILSVAGGYTTYLWTLNGNPIGGAVTDSYTVATTGIYAVIITNAYGCPVSSQPVDANGCTVADMEIYPNPAQSTVYIHWCKTVTARLFCADGKLISTVENVNAIDLGYLPNANYFLVVYDNAGNMITAKFITKLTR